MKPVSCAVSILAILFSIGAEAQPKKDSDGLLAKKKAAQPVNKALAPAVKSAELSGQVFVVTSGRNNIKLALVQVNLIAADIFLQYVKTSEESKAELLEVLRKDIPLAVNAVEEANVARKEASVFFKALSPLTTDSKVWYDAQKKESHLDSLWLKKSQELWDLRSKVKYFDSAAYYFEKLPHAVTAGKTDADGKFSISLPIGRYVLAATTSRQVLRDKEQYYWLVSVDVSAPNQSLMLSNDNMFETMCRECINPSRIP